MGGKGGGGGGGFDPNTRYDMTERPGYAIDRVTGDVYQGMTNVGNKRDYFTQIDKDKADKDAADKAAKDQAAADKAAADKAAADKAAADKAASDKAAADKAAADAAAADKLAHTPIGAPITAGGAITQPTAAGNPALGGAGAGDALGGAVLDPPKYWVGGADSFKSPSTRKSSLRTTL